MRNFLTIVILFLSIATVHATDQKQSVSIDYIHSYAMVLDEYKNPGVYSPINIFDGDLGSCYAEGRDQNERSRGDGINCEIYFDKPVYIDEIRIINGFAKNDTYFINNNRISYFNISFSNSKTKKETEGEFFSLKDSKDIQSIKLKKTYIANTISFGNGCINERCVSIIKGSKYNDTCITELAFYYKGQKIEIKDVEKLKKGYVARLQADLIRTFSDKSFRVVFTTPQDYFLSVCELKSDKNGNLKASNISKNKYFIGDTKTYIPDMWKVENAKLYLRFNGKWMLYKYYLESESEMTPSIIHLYSMPFEGLPENSEFTWIPGR